MIAGIGHCNRHNSASSDWLLANGTMLGDITQVLLIWHSRNILLTLFCVAEPHYHTFGSRTQWKESNVNSLIIYIGYLHSIA